MLNPKDMECVGNLIREMSRMRPPTPLTKLIQCACGFRKDPVREGFRLLDHPHLSGGKFLDNTCRGCREDLRKMAVVVCVTCKTTVVRIEPHTDKNGFVFKEGYIYHTSNCGHCCTARDIVTGEPNVGEILEVKRYLKKNNP